MENKGNRFDAGALGRPDAGRQESSSAASVVEKAKDMGTQALEKAKDMGSDALEKAKGYAANVSEQASRIGNKVEQTYETSRDYVTHRGLSGMGDDVTDLIRKNPLPAILVGVGIGFLLGRALREDR
jgi:ElaB/YqjD/DUF883 family membrane-anchored ribosome-binding protein